MVYEINVYMSSNMQDVDSSNDKQFLQERDRRPMPIQWSKIQVSLQMDVDLNQLIN